MKPAVPTFDMVEVVWRKIDALGGNWYAVLKHLASHYPESSAWKVFLNNTTIPQCDADDSSPSRQNVSKAWSFISTSSRNVCFLYNNQVPLTYVLWAGLCIEFNDVLSILPRFINRHVLLNRAKFALFTGMPAIRLSICLQHASLECLV